MSRSESTAATRLKLLDAAQKVFSRQGYGSTTIELISDAAGYSRGAFYAHFTSKEDILIAAVKAYSDELTPIFLNSLENASSAEEAIEIVVEILDQRSGVQGLAAAAMEALNDSARRDKANGQIVDLVIANWRSIGEALRRFFPEGEMPCETDELIAILVALTHNPLVGGNSSYRTKRLAEITLRAVMGLRPLKDSQAM